MSLYGIKDSANVTLRDPKTRKPVLYADYCNQTSLNMSSDAVYAMKKTAKAISWDTNREGTLTMEMQVFDLKWIALLFGQSVTSSALDWAKREIVKLSAGLVLEVSETIKEDSVSLFKLGADGISLGEEIVNEAGVEPAAFDVDGNQITLASGTAGDEYCVFYLTEKGADVGRSFTVDNEKFPQGYQATFDTMIRDTNQEDHFVQFEFYNLKPKSSLDLTLSAEDVCTLSIEWDVLVDNKNRYFTFNYLDEDGEAEVLSEYTVKFDNNGDATFDQGIVVSGGKTVVIPMPIPGEVSGKHCVGWTDADGNQYGVNGTTLTLKAPASGTTIELTAQFEDNA